VVRQGAIALERLREVVPELLDIDGNSAAPAADPEAAPAPGDEPVKTPEPAKNAESVTGPGAE